MSPEKTTTKNSNGQLRIDSSVNKKGDASKHHYTTGGTSSFDSGMPRTQKFLELAI